MVGRRRSGRGLAVLLAAAGMVFGAAAPASAEFEGAQEFADPEGDVQGQADPRADMVDHRAIYSDLGDITLAVRTAGEEPPTAPNWQNGSENGPSWIIDVDDDDATDFSVDYFVSDGQLGAGVLDHRGDTATPACGA